MRISRIETFSVAPRWQFLRMETDDGLVGWGEPIVEGSADVVAAAVDSLSEVLIGADPTRIEDLWQTMTRGGFYRGGPERSSAISGIDQALWDMRGKALGVPVYDLLGGPVRDRIRAYVWIGGDDPAEVAEHAAIRAAEGYSAVKMNASGRMRHLESRVAVQGVVERVEAATAAMGGGDVAIDAHGRWTPDVARTMVRALEHNVAPLFLEEPLVPELAHRLRDLCAGTSVAIATGERLYSRWDFREALEAGIALAQPDVSHAGGISEMRRIAALAELHGVGLAPHCPLGPIALAACIQVDIASPNAVLQESSLGVHYNDGADLLDYLVDAAPLTVRDGWFERPTRPGLGIDIDEAAVRKAAGAAVWRSPLWRHEDGSHAEW
ncbi:D-galactonate dehydratase [Microbacterium oxydans]|uniref:D-galactonate dehydratase n=1 Tax=Microbacterium oxydans TaxID=82380 RepID=A0A0F0KPZ0_9MICO|nr:galactonate dehydratase [Microbacterium oxydans]KJL22987.1 D-galactonate dehydratase [Microbacterium oxydans]